MSLVARVTSSTSAAGASTRMYFAPSSTSFRADLTSLPSLFARRRLSLNSTPTAEPTNFDSSMATLAPTYGDPRASVR